MISSSGSSSRRPLRATAVCLALLSSGCTVSLGSAVLPTRSVPKRVVEAHRSVYIQSEPSGAEVVEDGELLGTTPSWLDLSYQAQPHREEMVPCWSVVPLALVDLALAVAGAWVSYEYLYHSDAGKSVCAFGDEQKSCMPAVGVLGMLASAGYAVGASKVAIKELSTGCYRGAGDSRIIPRKHALRLRHDGWDEDLTLEMPRPPGSPDIKILFRAKEEADWEKAVVSETDEGCRSYLDDYPSGRWRAEAKQRIEELAWQKARRAGTALAFWRYLSRYPSGRWQKDSERALAAAVEANPDGLRWKSLVEILTGKNDVARALALRSALRRARAADLAALLSDKEVEVKTRELIIDMLADATAAPSDSDPARSVLCVLAAGRRFVPENILPAPELYPRVRTNRGLATPVPDWLNFHSREFAELPDSERERLRAECKEEAPPWSSMVTTKMNKITFESSPCARLRGPGNPPGSYEDCWDRHQKNRQGMCQRDARQTAERVFEPENALMERARLAGNCEG